MPVYTNPGPQQYAMHQQSRKDDWIRQLLQMFMMKQQRGTEEERWGKEHELSERRTKAYETQADTQRMQAERPAAPPKVPEKIQVARLLMQYGADTPEGTAIRKAYKITTPEDEAKAMDVFKKKAEYTASLRPTPGAGQGASAAESLRRYNLNKEDAALKTKWTRDKTFITTKTKRLVTERERMVKGLDPNNKKIMVEQQPRIANMDKAIAEMDRIDALLSSGGPLPPEEYSKAKNLMTNMEAVKMGVYDFEAGQSLISEGTINEAGLTKDMAIATSPTTGERLALVNGEWKRIIKKK